MNSTNIILLIFTNWLTINGSHWEDGTNWVKQRAISIESNVVEEVIVTTYTTNKYTNFTSIFRLNTNAPIRWWNTSTNMPPLPGTKIKE